MRRSGRFISNRSVARILRETGLLLEISGPRLKRGESSGAWVARCRKYTAAADTIDQLYRPIEEVAFGPGGLRSVNGIGPRLADHIHEILNTGGYVLHSDLKRKYPPTILELLEIRSMGARRVRQIWRRFKAGSVEKVENLARDGKLQTLPGFGRKLEEKILEEIKNLRRLGGNSLFDKTNQSAEKDVSHSAAGVLLPAPIAGEEFAAR